jgi:hypothetical protein
MKPLSPEAAHFLATDGATCEGVIAQELIATGLVDVLTSTACVVEVAINARGLLAERVHAAYLATQVGA